MAIGVAFIVLVAYCFTATMILASTNVEYSSGYNCTYTEEANDYNCTDDHSCPTWFYCNTQVNKCQCGKGHNGMMQCDDQTGRAAVSNCHCVTYDNETKETLVGTCFYNCENTSPKSLHDTIYNRLPTSPEELNTYMCGRFNRTGILCGQCKGNHSPIVLSYNLSCVECPDGHNNWWKFVLVGFVPLTFFYLFVVLFNINITSSRLHGVVLFSQGVSMPALLRIIALAFVTRPDLLKIVNITVIFYSFWNLDFFRSLVPNICLNIGTLDALAMDYTIAIYPLLLITLSYILIVLYDHDIGCIVYLWRPFHNLFSLFRRNWNVRTSVIDSFATFFLLSYVKILSVSSDLLIYTHTYSLNGVVSTRLFYDPSLPYFGTRHLPYAILALFFLTIFVIIPTVVLILYPFSFFQKFLSCFPIQWHFLRTFVDSLQGCYKDGTEPGTLDCRYFAQVGLFIRVAFFVIYATTLTSMFFVYATVACVMWLIFLSNVHPFKKAVLHYPSTDSAFLVLMSIFYISILGVNIASMEKHSYIRVMNVLVMLAPLLTIVYIFYIMVNWLLSHRRCGKQLFNKLLCWQAHHDHQSSQNLSPCNDCSTD